MILMNEWHEMIKYLERSGMTLVGIGKAVGLAPSSVSDIKQGYSLEPRGWAAVKMNDLYRKTLRKESRKPSQVQAAA